MNIHENPENIHTSDECVRPTKLIFRDAKILVSICYCSYLGEIYFKNSVSNYVSSTADPRGDFTLSPTETSYINLGPEDSAAPFSLRLHASVLVAQLF